jgi:WXG100 family type VII secretion target
MEVSVIALAPPVVRTDHDSLAHIARLFGQVADDVRNSTEQVHRRVEDLRCGGWVGTGATAFYREMDTEIFPCLERLAQALDNSATVTRRISRIFLEAEAEAGAVLAPNGRPAGAIAVLGTTGTVKDFSGIPQGMIRAAARALSISHEAVDINTVRQLAAGNIKACYIEDLKQPLDLLDRLKHYGVDPAAYTIYLHPDTGEELVVQRDYVGFRSGSTVFGKRGLSIARWKTLLVHETNHAVNSVDFTDPVNRYKSEFRAYWVAEYRGVGNLDKRAREIRQHIVDSYPPIKEAYANDPDVRKAIDEYTRPDGDLTNQKGLE